MFILASYDFDNYAQMSEILKFKVTEKFGNENKGSKQTVNSLMDHGHHSEEGSAYLLTPWMKTGGSTIDPIHQRRLILHFAFDVSGSIGPHYLQKSIEFAKAIVKKVCSSSYF